MARVQETSFGKRVSNRRRSLSLSQQALASKAQLSQPGISRIERSATPPDDLHLLTKLARALDWSVVELLEGYEKPSALVEEDLEQFYAFCPAPFCELNSTGRNSAGQPAVFWKSGDMYSGEVFGETNYCKACGTELVKKCPSCDKVLRKPGTRYCVICGKKVTDRPKAEEWEKIAEMHPKKVSSDDDIPF